MYIDMSNNSTQKLIKMTNQIKLIQGNCFDVIDVLTAECVVIDAIITDPPYIISNSGGGMMERDNRNFIKEIDYLGMCNPDYDIHKLLDKSIYLFSDVDSYCGVFYCSKTQLHEYISWSIKNKKQYGIGVWHKTNPPPLCNNKYLNDIEFWIYIKGKKSRILGDYNTKKLVYTSTVNKKDKKIYGHPTIKPIEMICNFIKNHTIEGQVVLDMFMGSGTTGVACKKLNRNFIGIEMDKEYFKIANERIYQE